MNFLTDYSRDDWDDFILEKIKNNLINGRVIYLFKVNYFVVSLLGFLFNCAIFLLFDPTLNYLNNLFEKNKIWQSTNRSLKIFCFWFFLALIYSFVFFYIFFLFQKKNLIIEKDISELIKYLEKTHDERNEFIQILLTNKEHLENLERENKQIKDSLVSAEKENDKLLKENNNILLENQEINEDLIILEKENLRLGEENKSLSIKLKDAEQENNNLFSKLKKYQFFIINGLSIKDKVSVEENNNKNK